MTLLQSMEAQSRMLAALAGSTDNGIDSGLTDSTASFQLGGARGAAALERWRSLLVSRPEEVTRRVRANRDRALGGVAGSSGGPLTMRAYLASEVPFGNAKTAAYLMFGLADVFDMLERGEWHLAEAHLALLLAGGEQAALQSW